ncbi:hypothetical protein V8E55_007375 [Tylopilus felleus]
MPYRGLYSGPTKLVLAFDIGTTYSGASYCILVPRRVPEVLAVARFPAQGVARAEARVPSLLYYDQSGAVRAAGAEALTQDIIQTAKSEGWMKAELWKLHLYPSPSVKDIPPLPSGKSIFDVLTDFIKYLFECCKSYIQECHPRLTWAIVEDSIEYILTYPSGWGEQQYLYRQAIQRAGLVSRTPSMGQHRVFTLTEGEACLQSCIAHLVKGMVGNQATPPGVVIIDAGGGIIDLSMFSITVTSKQTSYEEISPPESRLQGSVFVTCRARALMESKLAGWEHSSTENIAQFTQEFGRTTKLVVESNQKPAYIRIAERRTHSSTHCVSSGNLKLSGEEATSLFNDSVDAIIDAFKRQKKFATIPITTAFVFGGLSENRWVRSQLESYFSTRKIGINRTDSEIHKAVANGAVLYLTGRHLGLVTDKKADPEKNFEALKAVVRVHEQLRDCEALYLGGHIKDAAESLIELLNTAYDVIRADESLADRTTEITHKCVSKLEVHGDETSHAMKHDEAVAAYSAALSLTFQVSDTVLNEWARIILIRRSASEALGAAAKFMLPKFITCRAICDTLEGDGRVGEAITFYQQLDNELAGDTRCRDERAEWEPGE